MSTSHHYTVSGMTCEGCKAKVSFLLGEVEGVDSVKIDLSTGDTEVFSQYPIPVESLSAALGDFPKYKVTQPGDPKGLDTTEAPQKNWLKTYQPLLTIFAFILMVSVSGSIHSGEFMPMMAMNHFMAGFFLVFSFFKLLDVRAFASSYAMYDLLAIRVPLYGFVYPFIELLLGIAYLTGFHPHVTNMATIAVMGFSSLGVITSVAKKQKIQCACLGAVFNLPMSTVTIVEDLLMVAMAVIMWIVG